VGRNAILDSAKQPYAREMCRSICGSTSALVLHPSFILGKVGINNTGINQKILFK
jgi:hypothetical protein